MSCFAHLGGREGCGRNASSCPVYVAVKAKKLNKSHEDFLPFYVNSQRNNIEYLPVMKHRKRRYVQIISMIGVAVKR